MLIQFMTNVKLQLSNLVSCGCRLSSRRICVNVAMYEEDWATVHSSQRMWHVAPPKKKSLEDYFRLGSRNQGNGCASYFLGGEFLPTHSQMEPVIITLRTKYPSSTKHPFPTNKFEIIYLQMIGLRQHHVPRPYQTKIPSFFCWGYLW